MLYQVVQENLESFQNMEENLAEYGYKCESIPIIMQYNKRDLPDAFYHRVKHFKIRGSSGKLNIALDGVPDFVALRGNNELIRGDMHLIDSTERLERAYDDWKNGIWSQDPYIDMLIPSFTDPTMTGIDVVIDKQATTRCKRRPLAACFCNQELA